MNALTSFILKLNKYVPFSLNLVIFDSQRRSMKQVIPFDNGDLTRL